MVSYRRRHFSTSAARRRTDWARAAGYIESDSNEFTYVSLLTDYAADGGNTAGTTVARTHINLSVTSDTTAGDVMYWGLIAGPLSYVGDAVAGAPSPAEDPYADWAMYEQRTASLDVLTTTGYGHFFGPSNNVSFDIKSKRKLGELQTTWLLCVAAGSVTNTLVVNYSTSTLLYLP